LKTDKSLERAEDDNFEGGFYVEKKPPKNLTSL
jgi:hypothetical protein